MIYKNILETMPIAYARHKIIIDENQVPIDYEFLEVNSAFEKFTGLNKNDVIGKKITKIFPSISESKFNWIEIYGKIALDLGSETFEQFSDPLKKWYKIFALSDEKFYFQTFFVDIDEHVEAKNKLKESEDLLWKVMNSIPLRIFWKDKNLNYLGCNNNFLKDSGFESYKELVGKNDYDMNWREFADLYREDDQMVIDTEKVKLNFEEKVINANDELRWVKTSKLPIYEADGKVKGVLGIFEDITSKKLSEIEIEKEKNRYEELSKKSRSIAFEVDIEGKYTYINDVVKDVLGYSPEEIVEKKYFYDLTFGEEREKLKTFGEEILKTEGSVNDFEHKLFDKDGDAVWVLTNGSPLYSMTGEYIGFRGIDIDITKIKENEEKIIYLSYRDQLTGLYNRRFFEEEIKRLDTKRNYPMSVIMIDVNGLKLMNDAFGHKAGDDLIKTLANTMREVFRADDIISRVGGDEFVVLLPSTSEFDTEKLSERFLNNLKGKKVENLDISASIGYSTKEDESMLFEDVIKRAEAYMYNSKTLNRTKLRNKAIQDIINQLFIKVKDERVHASLVSKLCENIGMKMGFEEDEVKKIREMGLLHDVGKIAVPKEILEKTEELDYEDWKELKRHPEISYIILSSSSDYMKFSEAVLYHHEHFDGNGYPKKLKGEDIPLYSRIIAVADTYASMVLDRVYRKSISSKHALDLLKEASGKKLDPKIVDIFIEHRCYEF
ncbi:diguanylate cyclase (GGDEF)-like protein/PAS domain S-box-containing protein [Acetoanaerobium pronyense]|uniref:Diguanylate cyclase (GGDEF)-like protein/PAS domain S-box-containing protein n=1 Tax=Acetoanaerobium pronyense TaxID=1482736 RepID=A0ABS4KG58_9FIRM|nr:PAS domain S-box protein [Acetoanaerobium pronyense]MBP2026754.1 diguanylate cyclase (GGDEF)-like protein/PAS domain S-box-containing protein [Acetoanaerobium pronyense]